MKHSGWGWTLALACVIAFASPIAMAQRITYGPGMAPDASNATLPDTLQKLFANRNGQRFYAEKYVGAVSGVACTWDATHDVGDCINAAAEAAYNSGSPLGEVVIPAGTFGQTVELTYTHKQGVRYRAAGAPGAFGVCATTLKWIGSAGGIQVNIGPGADTVAGVHFYDICLDGNSLAASNVKLRGLSHFWFQSIYATGATSTAWDIDAADQSSGGLQHGWFVETRTNVTGTVKGWKIGQSSTLGNDTFDVHWLGGMIQYTGSGTAFECGAADSIEIIGMDVQPVGGATGKSLHLLGHASNSNLACRSNRFITTGGFGRDTATRPVADTATNPSKNNYIYQNYESGAASPLINGTATLRCQSNLGSECGNQGTANLIQIVPTNPTGAPTGGTRTMMGLTGSGLCSGTCSFTPRSSGIIEVEIIGAIQGSAGTTTSNAQIIIGTGTAPLNGVAVPGGSLTGGQVVDFDAGVAAKRYPIHAKIRFTGLTLGTAYWIDWGIASFNGTTTPSDLVILVREVI